MMILRRILGLAARRIAADPKVRAKAAEIVERELRPRAEAAMRVAKPRLEAARDELREIAREASPTKDPAGFARRLRDRVRDVAKDE